MIRKGVLIIGANKGIGLAIARKFALMNYDVFGTYHSNGDDEFLKIKENCPLSTIKSFKLDVSSPSQITKVIEKVFKSHPFIDCVVYNSGISIGEKMLMDTTTEEIDKTLSINLRGAIIANRESSKFLTKQKHGSIINISSIYGIYGGCCEAVYSASKSGLIGLSKSLAEELGSSKIRVNTIAPGFIQTDMTSKFNKEEKDLVKKQTPLQRLGTPTDVANAVYFLASDEASFITGQVLEISGGATKFN